MRPPPSHGAIQMNVTCKWVGSCETALREHEGSMVCWSVFTSYWWKPIYSSLSQQDKDKKWAFIKQKRKGPLGLVWVYGHWHDIWPWVHARWWSSWRSLQHKIHGNHTLLLLGAFYYFSYWRLVLGLLLIEMLRHLLTPSQMSVGKY